MFTLEMKTTGAAFDDGDNGRAEVARILRALADKIANGSEDGGGVYDVNGNRVGAWTLPDADADAE